MSKVTRARTESVIATPINDRRRCRLAFELEPFQDLQVVPFLLLLALDPVEHERAQAQVPDEHGEPDEPSSDHRTRRSPVTIAAREPAPVAAAATPTGRSVLHAGSRVRSSYPVSRSNVCYGPNADDGTRTGHARAR